MGQWHTTGCVLCAQNYGLEVLGEDNRMMWVKLDQINPRSQGYVCRKGLNVIYHQGMKHTGAQRDLFGVQLGQSSSGTLS